jgi:hypothetical protein
MSSSIPESPLFILDDEQDIEQVGPRNPEPAKDIEQNKQHMLSQAEELTAKQMHL